MNVEMANMTGKVLDEIFKILHSKDRLAKYLTQNLTQNLGK